MTSSIAGTGQRGMAQRKEKTENIQGTCREAKWRSARVSDRRNVPCKQL